MKVLLLAKGYPPTIGGVENYSHYIAEGLGINHEVEVLTFDESEETPKKAIDKSAKVSRLHYSDYELLNGWNMFRALQKKISDFSPDVIIATTWKVGLPYSILKSIYNIPFVVVAHGAEITRHRDKPILMKSMRHVLNKTDLVITVSDFTKDIVCKYIGESQLNVETVSNGIDLEFINPIDKGKAREKLDIGKNRPVLLTVSRIDERKGHTNIIKLMPKLVEKYPQLLYLIVGDGPIRPKLEKYIESIGLDDKTVKFAGFVSDEKLPLYYSAADIFIMLNEMNSEEDFEGFGFVFAEAGAYAKPVIGGNNAGPKEVIDHQKTGMLVNPSSEDQVLEAATDLLGSKEKRIRMGKAGREKVMQQFTLDVMVRNFEKKLYQIIQ